MSRKSNRSNRVLNVKTLAAAVALMAATGSAAAVDLYGGGATFPAQAYVGNNFNLLSPKARLSRTTTNTVTTTPIADLSPPNSVFAKYLSTFTGNAVSYCQTGSGTGKTVLLGAGTVTAANGECGNFSGTPAGFSAATAVPDYIGTDSPINQADLNSFARSGKGAVVQFPSIVGAIALPNNASVSASLNLTPAQICGIFSARITNWAGVTGSGSTGNINIIYRSDASGTSFAFTSYLATACNNKSFSDPTAGSFSVPANYFKPNQSFAAAVPAVPGQPGSTLPAYALSTARSGNTQVAGFTKATTDAFGYADVAEVVAQAVDYAFVSGQDPNALPASIDYASSSLLSGMVLDPTTNAPVAATGTTQPQCLRLINPNAVPGTPSYPILAATYLAGYYSGNGTKEVPLENLFKFFYNTTSRPTLPAGYAYIGSAAFRTAINSSITSCIGA